MSENQTLEVEPLIAKITYFATEQTAICAILLTDDTEVVGVFAYAPRFDIERGQAIAYDMAIHKIKAKLAWPRYLEVLTLISDAKKDIQTKGVTQELKDLIKEYLTLGQTYNFHIEANLAKLDKTIS